MKIEDLDPNFKPTVVGNKSVYYVNALQAPFLLEGFPWGDVNQSQFYRLPETFKAPEDVNTGALFNAHHYTSGGTVRFRSDAHTIIVRATLQDSCDMHHMPRTGSSGFDLYIGPSKTAIHTGTARPEPGNPHLEFVLVEPYPNQDTTRSGIQEWTLNFPLYGGVKSLELGFNPGAQILPPIPHETKPILFYGSSITQGGCASRPGNNYCSMLCRKVDAPEINLGFSGCGQGEPAVARAIASLDLAAFVFDYDHNAPTPEHLQKTHEAFFKIIREKHPTLPIIIMSKCNFWHDRLAQINTQRRAIIKATYDHAVAAGDSHVYWIDGESLFGTEDRDACTVDGCHPNDLGFYRMYTTVLPVLQAALAKA